MIEGKTRNQINSLIVMLKKHPEIINSNNKEKINTNRNGFKDINKKQWFKNINKS